MKKTRALAVLLLVAGALSSCSTPVLDKPMTISTSSEAAVAVKRLKTVSVEKCWRIILFVIPIPVDPTEMYSELMDQARKAGGNAIVDFQLRNSGSFVSWVYNYGCMKAVGTAAIVPEGNSHPL